MSLPDLVGRVAHADKGKEKKKVGPPNIWTGKGSRRKAGMTRNF